MNCWQGLEKNEQFHDHAIVDYEAREQLIKNSSYSAQFIATLAEIVHGELDSSPQ
jgi:hypothetical protein